MERLSVKESTLDSREVAKMVEKRHCDLIRDIEKYCEYLMESIERKIALNEFFSKSQYKDSIGRTLPCYQITKKGCELIAHKMTGKKGVQFTARYIERFHEMEQALQHPQGVQLEIEESYEYFDKYYNGQQVLTLRDVEHFTHCTKSMMIYYINHSRALINRKDYFLLKRMELASFKCQNPNVSKLSSSLYILTESGCRKLSKLIQADGQAWNCFKQLPASKQETKKFEGIPDDPTAQEVIRDIETDMTVIHATLKKFNAYNNEEKHEFYQKILEDTLESLRQNLSTLYCAGYGKMLDVHKLPQYPAEERTKLIDRFARGGVYFKGVPQPDGKPGDVINAYMNGKDNEQMFLYS